MSLLAILKLVGFATGAALHVYITWLIWKRRLGSRQMLTQYERTFVMLGLCLSTWFTGNLIIALHELFFGRARFTPGLRVWNTVTMIGVALLPGALLHAHVAVYAMIDGYRRVTARHVRLATFVAYLPMLFLPLAIYLVNSGTYDSFLVKLRPILLPYSIWYLLTLWGCAALAWAMMKKLAATATSEKQFFRRLAFLFVLNGAFEFIIVGMGRITPNDTFWLTFLLLSLLPTFLVAYHVYRYKLVDVAIKGSIVYAASAVVFIVIYIYGIRELGRVLAAQFETPAGAVEAILILGMFALAGPFMRFLDRTVQTLFSQEIGLYRDVVRQVSRGAAGFGEIPALLAYTEEMIRRGLELRSVKIVVVDEALADGAERRLAAKMEEWEVDVIEKDEDVAATEATAVYGLRHEGRLIGLMMIGAAPQTLTSEKRAVLDVLAGQVAIEIESLRLVEAKVRLERALANQERLATLGQMATTIAHEVKNPLSSIKSIAQVMREEEALAAYDRDLEIIVSEVDRLSRTVSQLLAFARPSRFDGQPVPLSELIDSIIALFNKEAKDRGVSLEAASEGEWEMAGAQAASLREALSNLILNAVQATDSGGRVRVVSRVERSPDVGLGQATTSLLLSVTDTGSGISEAEQRRIFEPFYTTKSRGTGLGLAIVQRRVMEMGGVLEVTSPVDHQRGSRFQVRIPIKSV